MDETIINLKSSGTINITLNNALNLRGTKGKAIDEVDIEDQLNPSSSAQREPQEPELNVKDPKKLRELHQMELL